MKSSPLRALPRYRFPLGSERAVRLPVRRQSRRRAQQRSMIPYEKKPLEASTMPRERGHRPPLPPGAHARAVQTNKILIKYVENSVTNSKKNTSMIFSPAALLRAAVLAALSSLPLRELCVNVLLPPPQHVSSRPPALLLLRHHAMHSQQLASARGALQKVLVIN